MGEFSFGGSVLLLCGRAGGALFAGLAGTTGVALSVGEAPFKLGELTWLGVFDDGLFGGGGGGGLLVGAVKLRCWFSAAILSARELNRGSSVSAMVCRLLNRYASRKL